MRVAERAPAAAPRRLWIGHVPIDVVTAAEALERIEQLVAAGAGGGVFTPNVDHVVRAERDPAFRAAYAAAALSLVDGTPLVWFSRALGAALPERIAGADLVAPLAARAARAGWRVFLLGAPGVVDAAAAALSRLGVDVIGAGAPRVLSGGDEGDASRAAAERVRSCRPDLVLVGFGAPKQELWIHRHRAELGPAVAVGVGAGLAFAAGLAARAPPWMSRAGLEWAHRLAREPRRLWRRYLLDGPRIAPVLLDAWVRRRARPR